MNIFDKTFKSLKETGEESKTKPIRVELIPKCLMFPNGVNAPLRVSSSIRPPEIPEWDAFIRYQYYGLFFCKSPFRVVSLFNSYRRSNGSNLASLIKKELDRKDLRVFLDVDNLEEGPFPEILLENIKNSRSFVLILTESALDRCLNDLYVEDWVHKEVST